MAANAGLTRKEIDRVASDGPVTGIDTEYELLCRATDELSQNGTLTDETLTELLEAVLRWLIAAGGRLMWWRRRAHHLCSLVSGSRGR